jgi:hypothetical protein
VLEDIVRKTVDLLAWPFGECDGALERLSAQCGYRASWSVWKGINDSHSRWRVPLGRQDNLLRFIAKSSGVYALTEAKWHRFQARREQRVFRVPTSVGFLDDQEKARLKSVL